MKAKKMAKNNEKQMSKQEKIGFHKGSLSTLAKERQELARILQIVEEIMKMHIAALKEEGVDLESEASNLINGGQNNDADKNNKKPPIDELI
jgi:biotin operon repressor